MNDVWTRLRRHPIGMIGLVLVAILFIVAAGAPLIAPYGPTATQLQLKYEPPSLGHPMGTDEFGRDVLSRIIFGSRIVVLLAVSSTLIATFIGVGVGLMSGVVGGALDRWTMRVIDVMLAFPAFLLAIALVAVLGTDLFVLVMVLAITRIPRYVRLIRSSVLSVRELEYVEAARGLGVGTGRIALRHVLPNCVGPILVYASLSLGDTILTVSGLSFLGIGVQPPTADWGVMLTRALEYMFVAPWLPIFPGLAIFLTVMGFNFLGDGLRDALDPTG